MLMATVVFLFYAIGCASRCTFPKSPCMYPRSLTLCICVFTSGRPMACTPGWMPATPPSAMQFVQVGLVAFSRLHQRVPLFRGSRRRYVRYYSTFRLPLSLLHMFATPLGTQGTATAAVHSQL